MNLKDFADLTAYDFCSMMGFNNGPDAQELGCARVWTKQDRILMEMYLGNAQDRVEEYLGFPVSPRFVCGERHSWNRHGLIGPLRWGYVQKIGTQTTLDIDTIMTDLTDDVFEFTEAVTFTDACEARVFYGNDKGGAEIPTISKSIIAGVLTVQIEKCALVDPTVVIPQNGLDYTDDNNFVTEVDLKRVYAQAGVGSDLIWRPTTSSCGTCSPCVEQSQLACPTIRDKRESALYLRPATFAEGVWTGTSFANCWGRGPDYAELDYMACYDEDCAEDCCGNIPAAIKLAIVHVALADMPRPVCGCTIHAATFAEDAQIPGDGRLIITTDFGIKLGHIIAQNLLKPYRIGMGGLLVAI